MSAVAYANPFLPPEWIVAHGLQPAWVQPAKRDHAGPLAVVRGGCPFAGAFAEASSSCAGLAAVLFASSCDPMRYMASMVGRRQALPTFFFDLPSTKFSSVASQIFRSELCRLGGFLETVGGRRPVPGELAAVMRDFDVARTRLRAQAGMLRGRERADRLLRLRNGELAEKNRRNGVHMPPPAGEVPLVLLGGPLVEKDFELFDCLERLGGWVAADGTEGGMRTLPASFDSIAIASDPTEELARAYSETIAEVYRRPNDDLHDWVRVAIETASARGVLFRRYVWCDLWHAELHRLREWSPVPVLEIDVNRDDHGIPPRVAGRIEAFLETITRIHA